KNHLSIYEGDYTTFGLLPFKKYIMNKNRLNITIFNTIIGTFYLDKLSFKVTLPNKLLKNGCKFHKYHNFECISI
ncbi:hypothetical protein, partial [Mycoplasma sp. VS30B]